MAKTTRAEQVRRRRRQQGRRRFDAVSRSDGSLRAGPLVSRPRSSPSLGVAGRAGARAGRRRGSLSGLLPVVRLPALPRITLAWRHASLAMTLMLAGMLLRMLADPAMYIDGVNLGGAALVPGQEIYARSGIAGQHIFWVDPAAVQRNIAEVPGIASVQVSVEWPNTVTILVTERIPVVTWIENEERWWVDADGQKFKARADLPGLLPVTVDDAAGRPGLHAAKQERVPPEAVAGALQLRELRPNIELLHYDALRGLSYADGRGWRGYFGVGSDMPQKLAVYERLVDDLLAKGIQPRIISVESPLAPYYQK
ncbi:MAG: FtsQ-type POTRA domain-containing protein [Anaerolineales bacterium]|nr:FtsQ-type POTRA domain-containing protein [Anaerolineales bacterium]